MPNHVKNQITASKSVIDKITRIEGNSTVVDLALIVPKPKEVPDGDVPHHVELAAEIALGLIDFDVPPSDFLQGLKLSNAIGQLRNGRCPKDFSDRDFDLWLSYLKSWRQHGSFNGLDWNRKHWGTKWNAYDTSRISDEVVVFETAWSAPHPVIMELARQTKAEIFHEWADEDTGSNVGWSRFANGCLVDEKDLSNSREGYELRFKLDPGDAKYYRLVDGKYEYIEE